MTVNTAVNKTIALGDGAATAFAFSFIGVAAAYISVIFTDADGVETDLAQGSDYSIVLNAAVPGAIWGVGGSITYPLAGSPIAAGTSLTIYRNLPLLQAISLQNQASYGQNALSTEQAMDLLEMQVQQVSETSSRAIVANITNTVAPDPLPPASQAAGKGVIFSPDGNSLIAGETPATGVISSAMAPVVAAPTLAAGRTAFGLGDMATEDIGGGLEDDGSDAVRVAMPVSAVAISRAIVASDFLEQLLVTGPVTLTAARANTYWNGFGFFVDARTAAVTIAINANDAFPGLASGVSLVIPPGASAFISTDAASSGRWLVKWLPQVIPQFQCRLAKSGANLQLSRFAGANLFINGFTYQLPATGPTLAPAGLSAATLYYIYAYVANSGAITLEVSVTAYATDTTWGHLIKTGDPSRTLVGMARTDAGAAFADSATQRFTRSYYNDPGIALANAFTATRTTASGSYVEINSEIRIEAAVWSGETLQIEANGTCGSSTLSGVAQTSIGIDSATPEDTTCQVQLYANNTIGAFAVALNKIGLAEGYHYATLLGTTNGSGTANWIGSASAAGVRSTLRGYAKR